MRIPLLDLGPDRRRWRSLGAGAALVLAWALIADRHDDRPGPPSVTRPVLRAIGQVEDWVASQRERRARAADLAARLAGLRTGPLPTRRPADFELEIDYTGGQGGGWIAHLSAGGATVGDRGLPPAAGRFPVSAAELDRLYAQYRGAFTDGELDDYGDDCARLVLVGRVAGAAHRFATECADGAEADWRIWLDVAGMIARAPRVTVVITLDPSLPGTVAISDGIGAYWEGTITRGGEVRLAVLPGHPRLLMSVGARPSIFMLGNVVLDTTATTSVHVHASGDRLTF